MFLFSFGGPGLGRTAGDTHTKPCLPVGDLFSNELFTDLLGGLIPSQTSPAQPIYFMSLPYLFVVTCRKIELGISRNFQLL